MWQLPEPGQRSTPMATPCERKTGSGSRQRRRCRLVSCIAPLETKGAAPKTQGNCVRCVGAQGKHGAAPALVMTPSRGLGTEAGGSWIGVGSRIILQFAVGLFEVGNAAGFLHTCRTGVGFRVAFWPTGPRARPSQ